MIFKRYFILAAVLLLGFSVVACNREEDLGEVVAIVNGEEVYENALDRIVDDMIVMYEQQGMSFEGEEAEMLIEMLREQALEQLIQQTVILQKSKEYDLLATNQEVDEELLQIKAQFDTDEMYQQALEMNNLTEDELRDSIYENLSMQKLIDYKVGDIEISEEDIITFYDEYVERVKEQKAQMIEEEGELTEEQEAMFEIYEFEEVKEDIRQILIEEERQELSQKVIQALLEESTIERLI